ncbi:putative transcription factor C2H2 family [Dioscorea sansibarensis]
MDDEGHENRIGSMDLNLYLGLPRSPGPRVLDLGSDLALGSILVPSSPSASDGDADAIANAGDSHSVMDIGGPEPYSPSNASYDAVQPSSEHTPYTPSYEPIGPSYIPIPPIDEEEEPDDPYSPSDVQPLQFSQEEPNESMAQDGVSRSLYGSASPPGLVDEPHVPYSPPYVPLLATPRDDNVPASLNGDESSGRGDGSSSQRASIQYPVLRFRRLIESQHRLRLRRRFRSSFGIGSERPDLGWHYPSTTPEPPAQESLGKSKVAGEGVVGEGSEEDSEDKSKDAANFECNICLDLAKDPVVTSCGHLFCWPCSSEAGQESKHGEDGEHGLKIPPRPRGNRLESFRQHFRPISTRRLGDGSWRRLFDARLPNSDRFEGHVDPSMHDMFDIGQRRLLARLRSDIMQRRERNLERRLNTGDSLLHRNVTPEPQNNHSSLPTQDGAADLWPRFSLYDLGRVVERLASSTNHYGASGSSVSPPNLEPPGGGPSVAAAIAADQASASSTMAVIQGDVAVPDGAAEPNSAGSSRSLRRRGRSSTSGSLDVDGGALHVRKRRRLN